MRFAVRLRYLHPASPEAGYRTRSGPCFTAVVAMTLAVALGCAGAAEPLPLVLPAPFASPPPAVSSGTNIATLAAAQSAQDIGMPSVAAALYRQLLAQPAVENPPPGMDQESLMLALATALLDAGNAAEAQAVLAKLPAPHNASWHLRAGLAALQQRKRDAAQAEWDAINPDDLSLADHAWYYFLGGELWDLVPNRDGGTIAKANTFYLSALAGAPTDLAKARFQLAFDRLRIIDLKRLSQPPPADLIETTRRNFEQTRGMPIGYDFAETYAVQLAEAGRRPDAVRFLQQQVLLTIPPQQRELRERFNFLLALVDNNGRGTGGRAALIELLENGTTAERQRQALTMLALASTADPQRAQFRTELHKLLAAKTRHPIADALLYYRARLALDDRAYAEAEKDANDLNSQFPGSPLRVHAFEILTQAAWDQHRYREAAKNAASAREALPAGPATAPLRTALAVLEAEARFRVGDYRLAADTYEAVLHERPAGLKPQQISDLIFQRVLAGIDAQSIDPQSPDAAKVLDTYAKDPAFDVENRWRAEWFLARAMQTQGPAKKAEAFARVSNLLANSEPGVAGLGPELRARMAWLRARLAFDAGEFETTEKLADVLVTAPGEISGALKTDIASTAVLLKARAEFELSHDAAAIETLDKLRADYPKSESAIYSYIILADHYAEQNRIQDAQKQLTLVVDNPDYKNSDYVPWALFKLAVLSERLGQDKNLVDAEKRLEELVGLKTPAAEELVFAARVKEGDIFRRLNDFPSALRAYEAAVNNSPQRPDVVYARLALAECHNALSSTDVPGQPSHAEAAKSLLEDLCYRAQTPKDVQVEAGYNLGELLARMGKVDDAVTVWQRDVIAPFLKKDPNPIEPEAKRPYWLGRTILRLGDLLERQQRFDEAKEAYQLMRQKHLPGEALAKQALERLGVKLASQ